MNPAAGEAGQTSADLQLSGSKDGQIIPVPFRATIFILAGGESRRMGSDKALLSFHGTTLIGRLAAVAREAARDVILVGTDARCGASDVLALKDAYPGAGPLGGIITALRHTNAEWNLMVACDMPAVTSEFLRELLAAAARCNAAVLIPMTADGRKHPLCAAYHRNVLPHLEAAWTDGVRSVLKALTRVEALSYGVADDRTVTNVNTPEAWQQFLGMGS